MSDIKHYQSAVDVIKTKTISSQLRAELPGLRGFSAPSLRKMRIFYEERSMLERNSFVTTNKFTEINRNSSVATDEMGQAIINSAVGLPNLPDL